MREKIMPIKETIFATVIAVVLAGCDLLVFPMRLFAEIQIADIEPIYFALIINQWLLIAIGLIAVRYLCPNLELGLNKNGLKKGMARYLPSALIFLALSAFAYYFGLRGHYNYTPSVWKVAVETFIYNISVGFLEELYIRGLLLAVLIRLFHKKKNAAFIAIVVSSVLFSLGHIPGMIGLDAFTVIMRLIWTLMLGIYFGVMYKKTGNLWVPIVAHALINYSGIAFCFTTYREFPNISVIIITVTSVIFGVLSIVSYFRQRANENV